MLIQEQEKKQLELFVSNLPEKPYCSNDLRYGSIIRPLQQAIEQKYIQHNKHTSIRWLVFDCDYAGAIERCGYNNLPPPNFQTVTKSTGKSHIVYGLEVPVHKTAVARAKPLHLLAKIEYQIRELVSGDRGYTNLLTKNPFHSEWDVYQYRSDLYDMPELCEWLTLPTKLPKRASVIGLGRNCTLFENLRHWAYREVLMYRLSANYQTFSDAVLLQAIAFNSFPEPLPQSEIRATAKSVAKWVWNKYTGRVSDEEFSATQSRRGRLGGLSGGRGRTTQDAENRTTALKMRSEGHTIKQISDALSVAYSTVGRWVK